MRKKRIAIFGAKGFPASGGAATTNENVVRLLNQKYEFTMYFVSSHVTEKSGNQNEYSQVVFNKFNGKRLNTLQYYIKSLLHALILGKYDIVHINHVSSGFLAPLLRIKYKVVGVAHGRIPKDDNKWNALDKLFFNISSTLFFKFCNKTISVCAPHILSFKKYSKKDICYIPNGIECSTMVGFKRATNEKSYLLFSASRIISLKGCHLFLKALKHLNYNGNIIIIGDLAHTPDYSKDLYELSEGLNVEFIGLIRDKNKLFTYIKNAELFIFPSLNEGMSNMLLEVAALKTPIVCSDIVENKAIFSDSEITFFKSGDYLDLANKISYALINKVSLSNKANLAYIKLEREYSWETIALKYSEVYDNL